MNPADFTSEKIQIFLLVFVRITAIISLLPVFGSSSVPFQLKAGFSFLLAILLFPLLPPVTPDQILSFLLPNFLFMVVKEVFVGITIGFASTFLFATVQFAGRLLDTQMGFAMVRLMDPFSDAPATVSGQFQVLVFSILFLLINGHYFLLIALQKSFDIIPLLSVNMPSENVADFLISMTADIFTLAIRLAAPVFTVLVLCSLSLGIVARTVPQINIFFVGLPMKIGVGIITLTIVLPSLAAIFKTMVENIIRDLWKLLYLMA